MVPGHRGRWIFGAVAALALGTTSLAQDPAAGVGAVGVPGAAPLASTWATPQGSWAIVAMGRLGHPNNTFWQMFFRPTGGASWSLVTPPAVADNGGLVADDGPGTSLTAGFEPSEDLTFSPIAQSSDEGHRWAPGILSGALLDEPDALSSGSGGLLALTRARGGTLLAEAGSLYHWRTVVGLGGLATGAGRSCGLVGLRAVSDSTDGPVVGGGCASPGVVGVFTDRDGSWRGSGPHLPGAAGRQATGVLRLASGPGGTAGLVAAGRGPGGSLFAMWRSSVSAPWTVSPALHPAGRLVASGFGAGGAVVVVTAGSRGAERAESVADPGARWVALPSLPAGTAAVALGPGAEVDALVVKTKNLVDWTLDPAGTRWLRGATLSVPLQFGSST